MCNCQVRSWEKQLHQIFDETDASVLSKHADEAVQKYLAALPKTTGENATELDLKLLYKTHSKHTRKLYRNTWQLFLKLQVRTLQN